MKTSATKMILKIKTFLFCAIFILGVVIGLSLTSVKIREVFAGQFPGTGCFIDGKVATTSLSFMTGGTGTTTIECNTSKIDAFSVNLIFAASSTVSTLRGHIELFLNNKDWFLDVSPFVDMASTTYEVAQIPGQFSFKAASTTSLTVVVGSMGRDLGFSGTGTTTAFVPIHMNIPRVSTDYTRVVLYMNNVTTGTVASSTNGAVWIQGITKEIFTR